MKLVVALLYWAFFVTAVTNLPRTDIRKGVVQISPIHNPNLYLRHCQFQAFATPLQQGNDDFVFYMVDSLNNDANAVSFQSKNYPDHYLGPDPDQKGRLGIITSPNSDDSSFTVLPGLSDPKFFSLQTRSQGEFKGQFVTFSGTLSGTCAASYRPPAGNVDLSDGSDKVMATWNITYEPPPLPATINIKTDNITHTLNPYILGCHSDSGYVHQPRGFYSQLIFGESFEATWNPVVSSGVTASHKLDPAVPFNNKPSMNFSFASGNGFAGLSNRGLGNEGLVFEANSNYEVVLYVRAPNGARLTARLDEYTSSTVLATTTIEVDKSTNWIELKFDLIPSRSTNCEGIRPGSDPNIDCGKMGPQPGHVCVRCGGQFTVGLSAPGSINIGYVFLQPGTWGRFKDLPVLLPTIQVLQEMGITVIRQGGTFSQTINWKDWRGPPIQRPSMQQRWQDSLLSGWGMFEMIDLCEAAGWLPIITLSEDQTPEDWGDLVEYCHGSPSTKWGGQRVADGHPAPYDLRVFELGNEQYNTNWVNQAKAMEDRATSLGMGGQLFYMFPTNEGLNKQDAARAAQLKLPISHIMPDIHVGPGGAIQVAVSDFKSNPNFPQSAINCETNAGTHGQGRALDEANDINEWFNLTPPLSDRMFARTASFCTSRSGHYDAFDQGISFFLPNMTWIQPPGYVHAMISKTYQPRALSFDSKGLGNSQSFSAQKSADGKTIVTRFVNYYILPTQLSISFTGSFKPSSIATMWTLSAKSINDANTPANPTKIRPLQSSIRWTEGQPIDIPEFAYVVIQFTV